MSDWVARRAFGEELLVRARGLKPRSMRVARARGGADLRGEKSLRRRAEPNGRHTHERSSRIRLADSPWKEQLLVLPKQGAWARLQRNSQPDKHAPIPGDYKKNKNPRGPRMTFIHEIREGVAGPRAMARNPISRFLVEPPLRGHFTAVQKPMPPAPTRRLRNAHEQHGANSLARTAGTTRAWGVIDRLCARGGVGKTSDVDRSCTAGATLP